MLGWLRSLFVKTLPTRLSLAEEVARDCMCPVCRSKDALLEGPTGGMSANAMCEFCGTRLNIHYAFGGVIGVDWTHGPQPEIWGGKEPTLFPSQQTVDAAKKRLENHN